MAAQAVQLDSHLAEYVPNDILSTAEGISYDLDVNELMVSLSCKVINIFSQPLGMAILQVTSRGKRDSDRCLCSEVLLIEASPAEFTICWGCACCFTSKANLECMACAGDAVPKSFAVSLSTFQSQCICMLEWEQQIYMVCMSKCMLSHWNGAPAVKLPLQLVVSGAALLNASRHAEPSREKISCVQLMQGIYASMSTLDAQAIQDAGQLAQNSSFSNIMNSSPQLHASPSHPRLIVTGQQRGGRILMDPPADLLQVPSHPIHGFCASLSCSMLLSLLVEVADGQWPLRLLFPNGHSKGRGGAHV